MDRRLGNGIVVDDGDVSVPVTSRCERLTQREMTSNSATLLTRWQYAISSLLSSVHRRETVLRPRSVSRQQPLNMTLSTVRQTVGVSRLRIRVRHLIHVNQSSHIIRSRTHFAVS